MNLFLFFYQGTVYSDYWTKKKKSSAFWADSFFISVLSVVLLGIFLFFPSLSVLTWLCTRLLIVLISSAGALYLQWYQCETCILLILWLSGSVMFTCTDFWFCFHLSLSLLPPSILPALSWSDSFLTRRREMGLHLNTIFTVSHTSLSHEGETFCVSLARFPSPRRRLGFSVRCIFFWEKKFFWCLVKKRDATETKKSGVPLHPGSFLRGRESSCVTFDLSANSTAHKNHSGAPRWPSTGVTLIWWRWFLSEW